MEQILSTESKVYNIPDDIRIFYKSVDKLLDRMGKRYATNILDIDVMLENISDTVRPATYILVHRRKITQALLKELVSTGKHYVKVDEIYPAATPQDVEIIQHGNAKYYAFINIPEQYTGYREPFKEFVKEVKEGIQGKLMEKGVFELPLIDENKINILTVSELRSILKFLTNLDLYYKVENNKLIVTC